MAETTQTTLKIGRVYDAVMADATPKFARLTGTSTGTVTFTAKSTTGFWALLGVRAHLSAVGVAGTLDVRMS